VTGRFLCILLNQVANLASHAKYAAKDESGQYCQAGGRYRWSVDKVANDFVPV
jgi:hypothetical protein